MSSRQTGFLEMNVGKHKGSLLVPRTSVSAGLMSGNREASLAFCNWGTESLLGMEEGLKQVKNGCDSAPAT